MRTSAPFTLPLRCALCQGEVTLQMTAKLLNPPSDRQSWACPYCQKKNAGTFPYKIVWAAKGPGVRSKG